MKKTKRNILCNMAVVLGVMLALMVAVGVKANASSDVKIDKLSEIPNTEHVIIPEGITTLEIAWNHPKLSEVKVLTIPDSLKSIRTEYAITEVFENLEEIIIDDSHPYFSLKDGVFYELNSKGQEDTVIGVLKEKIKEDVVLPSTVSQISSGVFQHCTRLKSITFSKEFHFFYSPYEECEMGDYEEISEEFLGCENLTAFKVEKGNATYSAVGGALYDDQQQVLYAVPKAYQGTFRVPDGVLTIVQQAFYECSQLTKVVIPDGVTRIDFWAFRDCAKLKKIKFLSPYAPYRVGELVFECWNAKIYVPKGLGKIYKKRFIEDDVKLVKEGTYRAQKQKITKLEKTKVRISGGGNIGLSWQQVPYAEGYKIQMKQHNQWKTITTIKDPTRNKYSRHGKKLGMKDGKIYRFRVVAYRGSVKGISASREVCHIGVRQVKAAYTAKGTITVKWNAHKELSGYKIRIRATDNSFEKTYIVKSGRKSKKVIKGLTPGKKYVVRVTGYKQKNKNQWESNMNPMLKVLVEK